MAEVHTLTLPGPMLQRDFWLYVWRIDTPNGERQYIGRTGDNGSPYATAPYTRMGQHLGFTKASNSLRRLLSQQVIAPEKCTRSDFVTYGPIIPEIGSEDAEEPSERFELHRPFRDNVAALEIDLRDALVDSGYNVLNVVQSNAPRQPELSHEVLESFCAHFSGLRK